MYSTIISMNVCFLHEAENISMLGGQPRCVLTFAGTTATTTLNIVHLTYNSICFHDIVYYIRMHTGDRQ